MSRFWSAGVAVLAAAALFVSLARPGTAQPPGVAAPSTPGRYQMQVVGRESNSTVFVLDTHTGHTWYRQTLHGVTGWTDMGSPKTHPEKR